MLINYEKLKKRHWFEDENGNELPEENVDRIIKKGNKSVYYRRCFPLELHDTIDEYCYHPKKPIIRFLCKRSRKFRNWVSVGKDRTFKPIMDFTTSFGGAQSQECIVAMVNSGNFTLEQAIFVYATSCERCMNVLLYRYLNGIDGYEEFSEEWYKAGTVCDFCRMEGELDG